MKKIIIIIIILLLSATGIFFLTKNKGNNLTPKVPINVDQGDTQNMIDTNVDASQKTEPIDQSILLKSRLTLEARSFIERWGSYSSDSNYINLRELLPKMSNNLKKIAEDKINQKLKTNEFYSLTTKVISITLNEFTDTKISFQSKVQQQEMKGKHTNILYKDVILIFIKEGDYWKVDSLEFK